MPLEFDYDQDQGDDQGAFDNAFDSLELVHRSGFGSSDATVDQTDISSIQLPNFDADDTIDESEESNGPAEIDAEHDVDSDSDETLTPLTDTTDINEATNEILFSHTGERIVGIAIAVQNCFS
jgi:hypothetical protein